MGRIKTIPVKKATLDIFNRYKDELPTDFEKLKELLPNYVKTPSKKIRNAIAGYLSRLVKATRFREQSERRSGTK